MDEMAKGTRCLLYREGVYLPIVKKLILVWENRWVVNGRPTEGKQCHMVPETDQNESIEQRNSYRRRGSVIKNELGREGSRGIANHWRPVVNELNIR